MSFVAGFVTGMSAGEAAERRKERSHFREYMERRGYHIVDQHGRPVPLDTIVDEALQDHQQTHGRAIIVASVALVAIAVITGGSAWAAVAVAG